jgi:hypothetical protein
MTLGTRRRRRQLDAGRGTRANVEQPFGSGSEADFCCNRTGAARRPLAVKCAPSDNERSSSLACGQGSSEWAGQASKLPA